MRLTTVSDAEAAAARAADVVVRLAGEALDARGVCHLALAGGSTPVVIHACIAVTSARIGGPACIGLTGSAIVGALRIFSPASEKCGRKISGGSGPTNCSPLPL